MVDLHLMSSLTWFTKQYSILMQWYEVGKRKKKARNPKAVN
jgi:hypothetical protein